jgi:hypothetical protein
MRYRGALTLMLAMACASPAWADTAAGLAAYQHGDYAKALKE